MSRPIHVTLDCPHCSAEIEIEVYPNEEDDTPETCPDCGKPLDQAAMSLEAQEWAMCSGE